MSKVIIKKINVPNKTYNRILVKASIIERNRCGKLTATRYDCPDRALAPVLKTHELSEFFRYSRPMSGFRARETQPI